jgi:CDP-diacylglycerol--glycerol-3-phosphate 3-phosphatidyltransferase
MTLMGLFLAVIAGVVLALGHIRWAVLPLALSGLADMLDGAVARVTGRQSVYGAALDSTVDRASEAVILGGLLVGLVAEGSGEVFLALLVLLYLLSSFLVSYTRARAEGLGFSCQVGFMERPARMVATMVIFLVGPGFLVPGFLVLFLLTTWTVLQRLGHIRREAARRSRDLPTQQSQDSPARQSQNGTAREVAP